MTITTVEALLAPWPGPYGGVPPFDRVRPGDLKPALLAAMAEELAEVDAITANPAAPTFDNTIAALERSGSAIERIYCLYGIWTGTLATPEVQAIEAELEPVLAVHSDKVVQNAPLFRRIDAVHDQRERSNLTGEQQRLVQLYWNRFVRAGARLPPVEKARVAAINESLASLFTTFSQNLLHDEEAYVLYLGEGDLAGLPDDVKAAAAAAARAKERPGDYAILNTRSSVDPFLTYSARRDLRERVWRTFYARGDNKDAFDNTATIRQILQLRAERARLLGFETHAHWRLADNSMAGTPEATIELMMRVWLAAKARVAEEVAEMQAIADREGAGIKVAPWDYRFYAEKVRHARYDLDLNLVKPYLQLEKLREAMFWVAGELYGLMFTPVTDVPLQHPDVRVWEVTRGADHIGLWYFDPFAREGKRSGAWMSDYRAQNRLDAAVAPIVSNNCNFVRGEPGQPILISWDDARTLFHEFGHALHGLDSNVTYRSLSGTNVFRDYVEFPSQVIERWLATPQVLNRFALHYQTGVPVPAELVAKIDKASTFRQGFDVTEYLSAAILDMRVHLAGDTVIDADAFEREALEAIGMPAELPMRHRMPQFAHIFGSDYYSAGYYSYLWADVIAADAAEAFRKAPGGFYDKAMAKRLHDTVMSVGNSVDPGDGYRAFRGRDPDARAYLAEKGFPVG